MKTSTTWINYDLRFHLLYSLYVYKKRLSGLCLLSPHSIHSKVLHLGLYTASHVPNKLKDNHTYRHLSIQSHWMSLIAVTVPSPLPPVRWFEDNWVCVRRVMVSLLPLPSFLPSFVVGSPRAVVLPNLKLYLEPGSPCNLHRKNLRLQHSYNMTKHTFLLSCFSTETK